METQADTNRELIEKWIVEFGFRIKAVQRPNLLWSLDFTDYAGMLFGIGQHKDHSSEIILQSRLDIDGEIAKRFVGLSEKDRKATLADLRFNLFLMDVENEGLTIPFKAVNIFQYIYSDGLTQDTLFQRFFKVRKAIQFIATALKDID